VIILIKLILAHLIGDFLLQPKSWVEDKERAKIKSNKLYLHTLIHGLLILILLWSFNNWLLMISIMLSHYFIDLIKVYAQTKKNNAKWFLIDQILHFISILILCKLLLKCDLQLITLFQDVTIWIYLVALLLITNVSRILIQTVLQNWAKALETNNNEALNDAGKYIGILERLFVFIFVITNNWEGIGFLLAAKSVFRFGDLKESKDRKLTEYVLIGTLLSFGLAILTGLAVLKLITIVNAL